MKTLSDIIFEKLKVSNNTTDTSQFVIEEIYTYIKPLKLSEFLNYISFDELEFTEYIDNFNDIKISKNIVDAFDAYDNNFEDNLMAFINILLDIAENYNGIDSFEEETTILADNINKQTEPHGFNVKIQSSSHGYAGGSDLTIRIHVELTDNTGIRFDSLALKFHRD